MSRVNKYSLFVIIVLLLSCSVNANAAETYRYATTDMTWAEFYAGETGETSSSLTAQSLDAVSTPTTQGLSRFPLVLGVSGDTGTTISGRLSPRFCSRCPKPCCRKLNDALLCQ